jgi:ATP/maltotriose-dependent transcriptional regulator MalT
MVVALALFWLIHGHYSEGEAWHRRVLAAVPADPSPLRARALWTLGHVSLYGMEMATSFGVADTERAITMARQMGDAALLTRALIDQSLLLVFLAPDTAQAALEEATDAARRAGDEWALAYGLQWLAFFWVFDRDRFDLAEPLLSELHGIATRSQSPYWLGWHGVVDGMAAWHQGRVGEARTTLEAAAARAYELGDLMLEAYVVAWLLDVKVAQGEYEEASSLAVSTRHRLFRSLDECRQGWVELGSATAALARGDLSETRRQLEAADRLTRPWGVPFTIAKHDVLRGRLALEQRDVEAAGSACDAASTFAAQFQSPWALVEADNLGGRLARAAGELAAAEDQHQRALAITVQYGLRGAAAETIEALASLANIGESHAEAVRLFSAAHALRGATGQRRWPLDQPAYEADVAQLRAHLGDEAFEQAWKEGIVLSMEEAAAYASRARGERKRPSTGWAALTPTELEVVALAAQGLSNAEIGRRMFISAGTAKVHLSHIYTKLSVANRAELAAQATARGIGPGVGKAGKSPPSPP